MSYSPVIPLQGYAGWQFLQRTREAQKEAFVAGAAMQREEAYFRERIGSVATAEELVSDRRLLSVALGAFGLSDDIDNRYFIRKVLEDGTLTADALANKLSDKRYLELSQAFGFGDFATPRNRISGFADRILARFEQVRFEEAVGEQDNSMRLAMNAERELPAIAAKSLSVNGKWLSVLGSAPLREVMQTAFGLPDAFAAIDLDQQVEVLKEKAEHFLGSAEVAQFSDPDATGQLIRLYLARSQMSGFGAGYVPGSAALTLLQGTAGAGSLLSLLV
ncbi:DUF1217 domain-containing protein [Albidovulum sp.]